MLFQMLCCVSPLQKSYPLIKINTIHMLGFSISFSWHKQMLPLYGPGLHDEPYQLV